MNPEDQADDYAYSLASERIAQVPADPRDSARLLDLTGSEPLHRRVSDLPELVGPGDLIVVNESRVFPARLQLRKPTGGAAEVLLLERLVGDEWEALVRPSRRLPTGSVLQQGQRDVVEVGGERPGGRRTVRLLIDGDELAKLGQVPLPPYITEPLRDAERYQTVYARVEGEPGSVAAPTAGLHLTTELLERCRAAGADVATVDLAVGIDTFRPLTASRLDDHEMHSERYAVPVETLARARAAERVIAVGTTTVRALEAATRGQLEGRTDLFIRPGFHFEVVDVLLTNFHMPRSTLLVLLAAFAGPRWREAYEVAQAAGYRFLSFGDAMLVARDEA